MNRKPLAIFIGLLLILAWMFLFGFDMQHEARKSIAYECATTGTAKLGDVTIKCEVVRKP